jgi:hypothetical protein
MILWSSFGDTVSFFLPSLLAVQVYRRTQTISVALLWVSSNYLG